MTDLSGGQDSPAVPSGSGEFEAWFAQLGYVARERRWRYLVVLSGDRPWCAAQCRVVVPGVSGTVWVGEGAPDGVRPVAAKQATYLLGTESNNVVFDAWSGFHPNAFAALAGTVRAGGVMLLMTPPLAEWAAFDDPDYQRMRVPGHPFPQRRRFLAYLAEGLRADGRALLVEQGSPLPVLPKGDAVARPLLPAVADECLTDDQAEAVLAVERVVDGHRNRPLVLCSDRGRGKTAALGIAAAHLLKRQLGPILVTAPLLHNVAPLFDRVIALLDGAQAQSGRIVWQGAELRYLAPDQLLAQTPAARLLLVDEAAAIPAPLLSNMLNHYHRLVFATTVHGYEGTGRGFALRFQAELSRRMPQWRYLVLTSPVRWAPGCPLEASVNHLLLLQANAVTDDQVSGVAMQGNGDETVGCPCESLVMLDRDQLLEHRELLSQLFGLLMMAHYRTTPDDLRLLLDGPNMGVALLLQGSGKQRRVVGAVLYAREGQFSESQVEAVVSEGRRPRGHLLPQTVWAQAGNAGLLPLSGWRIVRIAVHPQLQRNGRGSAMLRWLAARAREQGVDYLGSSFGATPELIAFWWRAGFVPLCLGSRRDAASGTHALVVIQPLSPVSTEVAAAGRELLAEGLPMALGDTLRAADAGLVVAVLAVLPQHYQISERDVDAVRAFAAGLRTYEACDLALWKMTLCILHEAGPGAAQPATAQQVLLVSRLLQRDSWQETARRCGLRGKAHVQDKLRAIFADALGGGEHARGAGAEPGI